MLVLLTGSVVAAASCRSFRAGIQSCAWAVLLGTSLIVVAWLAEAPHWHQRLGRALLDGDGGFGIGVNLGDAVGWALAVLMLWALPFGVIGAFAGSARARRQRRDQGDLVPTG